VARHAEISVLTFMMYFLSSCSSSSSRNEVQRWTVRTNQLIEQYNKVDPEEYRKLL